MRVYTILLQLSVLLHSRRVAAWLLCAGDEWNVTLKLLCTPTSSSKRGSTNINMDNNITPVQTQHNASLRRWPAKVRLHQSRNCGINAHKQHHRHSTSCACYQNMRCWRALRMIKVRAPHVQIRRMTFAPLACCAHDEELTNIF